MSTADQKIDPTNYNKHNNTCLRKAGDDEPLFVIRARDKTAGAVITAWLAINIKNLHEDKIKDTQDLLQAVNDYQATHPTKYPD